jgi:hypothetical protein
VIVIVIDPVIVIVHVVVIVVAPVIVDVHLNGNATVGVSDPGVHGHDHVYVRG